MKRRSLLMSLVMLSMLPLSGLAHAEGDLELRVPGKLTAATEGTYAPFSMRAPNGNLDGLEIRVMTELARRIGVEYEPVLVKWESLLIGLEADQYDMTSATMDITPDRQKKVTFVDGWLESGGRVVVPEGTDIAVPADVKGRTVGALLATSWVTLAEELGAKQVKTYKAEADAMQDLANGNVDAIITDAIAAGYAIKVSNLKVKMLDEPVSTVQKGFAIKQGKPNLTAALNKALSEMIADGTYAKIANEMIGFDPAPKEPIRSLP